MNEMKHDDGCRCQGCCREKFKTIDPATFGKAPWPCNHTLYSGRCWLVLPEE